MSVTTAGNGVGCFDIDIDYAGFDIGTGPEYAGSVKTKSASACQELCQAAPLCQFWTWDDRPGEHDGKWNCWLKSSEKGRKRFAGHISGPKRCNKLPGQSQSAPCMRWMVYSTPMHCRMLSTVTVPVLYGMVWYGMVWYGILGGHP